MGEQATLTQGGSVSAMDRPVTFEERSGCEKALFEWAESYDGKNWDRLANCIAPSLRIDYSHFLNKVWEAMPAQQYVEMVSSRTFIGNPLLRTQHLIGMSTWERETDGTIAGHHQVRVAHQKYSDETFMSVAVKGHDHGCATTWYKLVDGKWKFAGIKPQSRWFEYDFDQIFGGH